MPLETDLSVCHVLDGVNVGRIHRRREGWQDGDAACRQHSLTTCHCRYRVVQKAGRWQDRKLPNISQGSVATRCRCGGIFDDDFISLYKFTTKCYGET